MQMFDCDQRGPEWKAARIGCPTASMFDCLVTPKTGKASTQYHDYAFTLANELHLNDDEPDGFMGNAWTNRGEAMEDPAVGWYEFITNQTVEQIGFVTEAGEGWAAGCSPDGFVGDEGMLEIKALKAAHHTAAFMEFHRNGIAPPKYRPQTQGQMLITGRKWNDLLFFHDRLEPFIVRQTPDAAFIEVLKSQLVAVCKERDETLAAMRDT